MDTSRTKITGRQVLHLRTVLRSIDFHAGGLHEMMMDKVDEMNMDYIANVIATIEDLAIIGLAAIEHAEQCSDTEYVLTSATKNAAAQTEYTANAPTH